MMASIMAPWPEWQLEYVGSRFLGRLLGLWSNLWISLVKKLFRLLTKTPANPHDSSCCDSNENNSTEYTRPSGILFSFAGKLSKMSISTLLTLGVWRIVTLKAVWVTVGESGDQILTAILLFVSASWVISLGWIYFSKSKQTEIPAATYPPTAQTRIHRIS
jgi:hypothetical protein